MCWRIRKLRRYVMKSGVPFHMCPLDTTREVYLTADDIEAIGAIGNPVARMNYEMCRFITMP